jgi:RNA polymerase sigma factor (sigma-70 family)
MDDAQIIELIQKGDERAIDFLYRKHYRMMARLVMRNSGTEEEAKDVFQDALIVFWEKVAANKLVLTSRISTYLYSVCQNLWRKELDRKQRLVHDDDRSEVAESLDPDREERIAIVNECISRMGDTCRKLLTYYYFDRLSMTVVAERLGFANADTAKTKKYKCKQELDKLIRQSYKASDFLD